MSAYAIETLDARPYLYVAGEAPLEPEAMSAVIGAGFARVAAALQEAGAAPASRPMVLYTAMDRARMVFRVGFFVDEAGAAAAGGDVQRDRTPGGATVRVTHTGPYDQLANSYEAVMAALARDGLTARMPTWEVYIDDPGCTPPEALRTDIHIPLASS